MSLGDAYINIHATTASFKAELDAQVGAALRAVEAAQVVSRAAPVARTASPAFIGPATEDEANAALVASNAAVQAQILKDDLANLQVEAAAQRDAETVRIAEAKDAAAQIKAIAADTAAVEKEYRAAVAAAAKEAQAEILETIEVEANQEKAIAADLADIEKQYRAAVAAEVKANQEAIREAVEVEANQEKEYAAAVTAAVKEARAEQVAAAKAASAEILATVNAEAAAEKAAAAEETAAAKATATAQAQAQSAAKAAAEGAVSAGRSLTTAITLPIVATVAASAKMAVTFQQAVQKVVNLSQGLNQSTKQVSDTVLQVSSATGVAATDVANAYYKVAAAGYVGATGQQILLTGAKEAAIGLGDAATTTDALIQVINNYGAANLSAAKAGDIFTNIVQNSKFAPDQLASSLGRVLPVAAQLGISFQDLGGQLAALSHSTSNNADTAVTGLTALFSNLIAATKTTGNASKEFQTLGLSAQGLIQDLGTHGVAFALDEVKTALEKQGVSVKTTEAQYQDLANNLGESLAQVKQQFGQIDLGQLQKIFPNKKAFLTFLGLTDENNQAAATAAEQVGTGVAGALEKAFNVHNASDVQQISLAVNQFKNDLINLGDEALPKIASLFNNLQKFVEGLKADYDRLSPSSQKTVDDLVKIAAEIGPLLFVGGKLATLFGSFGKLLDANPFVVLAGALALLYLNSESFRKGVDDVAGALKPLASNVTLVTDALKLLVLGFAALKFTQIVSSIATVAKGWLAVRDAEVAAEAANPVGAIVVAGAVAIGAAYEATTAILNHFSDNTITYSSRVKNFESVIGGMVNSIKEVQGPTVTASNALHQVAIEAQGVALQFPIAGQRANQLGIILTQDLGLSADQARAALESLGYSAADANSIIAGISTASAVNQFNALTGAANAAAAAAANAANAAAAGFEGAAVTYSTPGGGAASGGAVPVAAAPAGGGGGGGGGATAPTAAQTAAANFQSSITTALTTVQDAIASFSTSTEAQVEAALEALDKSIAAAFKAEKVTEPSALVTFFTKDNAQLEALATQRDVLTKAITAAQEFATDSIAAAQKFDSIVTAASTLADFSTTVADLSKLHIVLPGDNLTTQSGAQASVNNLQTVLNTRLAALTKFQADIQGLINKGLNSGTIQDLITGGVDSEGALASALNQATPGQIAALNASQKAVTAISNALGQNAGDAAAQAGIDAGQAVVNGILQGLEDKNGSLLKAMTTLADALVNQIKKDLKIKSPSRVMHELGGHIGTGLEHGILGTHGAIAAAAAGMAESAIPAIRTGSFSALSPGASQGGGQTVTHHREYSAPVTIHNHGGGDRTGESVTAAFSRLMR